MFKIDVSKYEYTKGKVAQELDFYKVYIYSPAMLAIEKMRAICQQMPEYGIRGHASPRARDFYDIYVLINKFAIKLDDPEIHELARNIFAAKKVPLQLLGLIKNYREFHRPDWPAVTSSVDGTLMEFDDYFDFVVDIVRQLESLWIEES